MYATEKETCNSIFSFQIEDFEKPRETSSKWSSTKKVRATQNFIKIKMNGRVNILWHIFEKSAKKYSFW